MNCSSWLSSTEMFNILAMCSKSLRSEKEEMFKSGVDSAEMKSMMAWIAFSRYPEKSMTWGTRPLDRSWQQWSLKKKKSLLF
jgi:hypothetical protein